MKIRDLRPGMTFRDDVFDRIVRIKAVDISDGIALVSLSDDGREIGPFPYGADDETGIAPLSCETEWSD